MVTHAVWGEGTGVRCRHKIPLGLGNGQRTDTSSLPGVPRSFRERVSEPHSGCCVPLPTLDTADALSGAGRTEGSAMELGLQLDLDFPPSQAANGTPRPLLPRSTAPSQGRMGCPWLRDGRQALALQGEPTPNLSCGYFYLPSLVSNLPISKLSFPLRAIFSPRSIVLGRCVGQPSPGLCRAPQPPIVNHSPSLSKQHRALTTGSLPLIITSAYTLGLKYMVRNRSV